MQKLTWPFHKKSEVHISKKENKINKRPGLPTQCKLNRKTKTFRQPF